MTKGVGSDLYYENARRLVCRTPHTDPFGNTYYTYGSVGPGTVAASRCINGSCILTTTFSACGKTTTETYTLSDTDCLNTQRVRCDWYNSQPSDW